MSPPDTNVEKQARRHRPSLGGIVLAVGIAIAAGLIFVAYDGWTPADQAAPEATE